MPTGIKVTNPKFATVGRKLKEVKHCTIPKTLNKKKEKKRVYGAELKINSGKGKSHRGENAEKCTKPSLGVFEMSFLAKKI